MNEKDLVIDCLRIHYGIAVTSLTCLPLGADMQASVYKAETRDKGSYFVKLKQGHSDDVSIAILTFLEASGVQEIIPPVKTIDGKAIQQINNGSLIVYSFIDAQNGFCRHLSDEQWVALGKVLKQVHELDVPQSVQVRMKKELYLSKWREALRSFDNRIDENFIGDETTRQLQAFMKEHRAIIRRLVDRADFLSLKAQEESSKFVLCHSDIHAGNVLIEKSGAIHIVDWDEPIMAPKERDLMFIGGGVANVWNDPREERLFYEGYGNTNINRIILAYYRHERIVQDIAEYAHALLLTKDGGESRLEMYKHFVDMFKPNGVIEIAFKTDGLEPQKTRRI